MCSQHIGSNSKYIQFENIRVISLSLTLFTPLSSAKLSVTHLSVYLSFSFPLLFLFFLLLHLHHLLLLLLLLLLLISHLCNDGQVDNKMYLEKYGADKAAIVRNITRAFAHQIFVDGFYTADPHPGDFMSCRIMSYSCYVMSCRALSCILSFTIYVLCFAKMRVLYSTVLYCTVLPYCSICTFCSDSSCIFAVATVVVTVNIAITAT